MKIQRPGGPTFRTLKSPPPPPPQSPRSNPLVPLAGGIALAVPSAMAGTVVAKTYGPQISHSLLRTGVKLLARNQISVATGLKLLPYLHDRVFQARLGGVAGGLVGFAVGAALLYDLKFNR